MAGTKFAYVKNFELPDPLLPGTYILLRLDGHGFHRLSQDHDFVKPNDERALQLMDHAARGVMNEFKDIVLAFGESDEYSFLFRKSTALYNRRQAKILTTVTSLFTSSYVLSWSRYFSDSALKYPPSFDGRIVLYPSAKEVQDYFAWRQADTHINNLYNTTFWALVQQGGQTTAEAHATLRGTVSKQKHEVLFSRFGVNYNSFPERYRKGSVLVREEVTANDAGIADSTPLEAYSIAPGDEPEGSRTETGHVQSAKKNKKPKAQMRIELYHCDIIEQAFWDGRPYLLE